jgi:hypothetical protein
MRGITWLRRGEKTEHTLVHCALGVFGITNRILILQPDRATMSGVRDAGCPYFANRQPLIVIPAIETGSPDE